MEKYGLLVGMHFRPPAKILLDCLPSGTELKIEAEPENPYDPLAIRVVVESSEFDEPTLFEKEADLIGAGRTPQEVLEEASWHLGYLAREGNKDLTRKSESSGLSLSPASAFADETEGLLVWGPNGEAIVRTSRKEAESDA